MGYIFILRHGPTLMDPDKPLDKRLFKTIAPRIIKRIQKYADKLDIIFCSPADRCKDTAKILNKTFNTYLKKKDNLLGRFNSYEKDRKRRSSNFGKKIYKKVSKKKYENVLLITHSSVLRNVLSGVCREKIGRINVDTVSLSVYNTKKDEFVYLNKSISF